MRWKPYAVLAGCLLAVALLASVVPLPAADVLALGPGHEAAIAALPLPYRDGGPVGAGATLSGIAIFPDRIVYTLTAMPGVTAQVVLRPPQRAGEPMLLDQPPGAAQRSTRLRAEARTSNCLFSWMSLKALRAR